MESIPIAQPVPSVQQSNIPNPAPEPNPNSDPNPNPTPHASPIMVQPLTQPLIPTQELSFQICRTCGHLFHRDESNKMTSHYFRCEDCINKQVSRSILVSCILQ